MTRSSYIQAASRSLPETSALLPSETNDAMPRPESRAMSSIAMPTPPDCDPMASPPEGGRPRVKVALREMAGSFAMTPRQFGPTIRMLCLRAAATISS